MNRLIQLIPITLLACFLGGCGTPRPISYYGLRMPVAPTPAPAHNTYAIDLAVRRLTGPSLLETAPIVYRTGANQMGTYQYQRWEDAPVELVQAKLIILLRSTGLYQSVGGLGSPQPADFVVRGRLYQFEEVDAEGITGNVTMEVELYNRRSGKVLWSHYYSQAEPAESKALAAVVQALDSNLERGLREVVKSLGDYFASNPPAKTQVSTADAAAGVNR